MTDRVILHYNPNESLCEIEARGPQTPSDVYGQTFRDEIPEDQVDIIQTDENENILVIHPGAGPVAFRVTIDGNGEIELDGIPTEVETETDEYFEDEEESD